MNEETAEESGGNVAESADHRSPKLTTAEAGTAGSGVIEGGARAARVGEYLAERGEKGKSERECKAHSREKDQQPNRSPGLRKTVLPKVKSSDLVREPRESMLSRG